MRIARALSCGHSGDQKLEDGRVHLRWNGFSFPKLTSLKLTVAGMATGEDHHRHPHRLSVAGGEVQQHHVHEHMMQGRLGFEELYF